jgi:hypothetical protein
MSFAVLLAATLVVLLVGMLIAFEGSRDVFHPLVFIGPMMIFLYVWMPYKLLRSGDVFTFFDSDQLIQVQARNLLAVTVFTFACLMAGVRIAKPAVEVVPSSEKTAWRMAIGAILTGGLGLAAWLILIIESGGPVQAFSQAYSGGWDDSGYIRDGSILLLAGILLILGAIAMNGWRLLYRVVLATFTLPWLMQALLTSRRGPTFELVVVLGMGWFLHRAKRPPVVATCLAGLMLGWLVLFLVTNRGQIYIGSDMNFTTDVTEIAETANTGNEFVYGSGALLSAMRQESHFWGKRYLAQILVRPIPSAIWPTKYEDFGVPELLQNAGTGDGIGEMMGWEGAPGSAPGIVSDLWIEFSWLAVPVMAIIGWCYARCWQNAVRKGRQWVAQYAVLSALSIYLVMQTMEAVIFRFFLLSIPIWAVWKWATYSKNVQQEEGVAPLQLEAVEEV